LNHRKKKKADASRLILRKLKAKLELLMVPNEVVLKVRCIPFLALVVLNCSSLRLLLVEWIFPGR